jgi:hypothetical protein
MKRQKFVYIPKMEQKANFAYKELGAKMVWQNTRCTSMYSFKQLEKK